MVARKWPGKEYNIEALLRRGQEQPGAILLVHATENISEKIKLFIFH